MEKDQLRQIIKQKLSRMPSAARQEKSRVICRYFTDTEQFRKASVVMVYLSLPHEVDTTAVILNAWQHGKTVAAPRIFWQQNHMIPVQINSLEKNIELGRCGLKNPTVAAPVPLEDIDLVITPGLAFDRLGNRLGRGSAYYDRFFQNKKLRAQRYAFAFTEQIVESIPVDSHDQGVDFVITEQGVIECRKIEYGKSDCKNLFQGGPINGKN